MNPKDDKTTRTRRQYSAEEKVRLLKLHLVDGQPISAVCDQHQIHPRCFTAGRKPSLRTERRLLTARPVLAELIWGPGRLSSSKPASSAKTKSSPQ